LDGEMTSQEEVAFEAQVKTDPELAQEIELHQLAIVSIQHGQEVRFQEEKARVEALAEEVKAEQMESSTVRQPINEGNKNQSKSSPTIIPMWRKLLPIAAMLLLIPAIYFIIVSSSNPLENMSAELIEQYESTTMGNNNPNQPEKAILLTGIQDFKQKDYSDAIISFDEVDALYRLGKKDEAKTTLQKILNENDEALKKNVRLILDKL